MTDTSWLGRRFDVTVGAIAHGGHCVARVQGRVVFLRHCLPGERVVAEVTEDNGGSYCRADAVEVLEPSTDRVPAPCSHAHPGGCGGCDFQHVDVPAQRRLKAAVINEQFRRLAGLEVDVDVQPVSGDPGESGLGWRRRIRYAVESNGQLGLRAHRSHAVVPVQHCPLGAPGIGDVAAVRTTAALAANEPGRVRPGTELEAARGDTETVSTLLHRSISRSPARRGQRRTGRPDRRTATETRLLSGPERLDYEVAGRHFEVAAGGFWQTHPAAAGVFTAEIERAALLQPGERALDLYAGAGLFTAALAAGVTDSGRVIGIEADRNAVADADRNLAGHGSAEVRQGSVTAAAIRSVAEELHGLDVTVLDPPRTGAGAAVMAEVLAVTGRVLVYVACDPAALARDVRTALDAGWTLDGLRAFDAFPMTHHVECIATLRPPQDRPVVPA